MSLQHPLLFCCKIAGPLDQITEISAMVPVLKLRFKSCSKLTLSKTQKVIPERWEVHLGAFFYLYILSVLHA
jgi:hypothetical protein